MKVPAFLVVLALFTLGFASHSRLARAQASRPHVILLMLDGVRWQEFFGNKPDPALSQTDADPIFRRFWAKLAPEGVVYGNAERGSPMSVSNPYQVSLPAYQSIFAGTAQPCDGNDCGRTQAETFPERLIQQLRLKKSEVAAIASWVKIPLAFEHVEGATVTNAGHDPGEAEKDRSPWKDARHDFLTWERSMKYLAQERPTFLFISLNDADELAHMGDYAKYVAMLRTYDTWMADLADRLEKMGKYGRNTTLIVTTDHGRGIGPKWKDHGVKKTPDAGPVWLYARGPHAKRRGTLGDGKAHSHLDIRPTIEALLGLCPIRCSACGLPLPEVTEGLPINGADHCDINTIAK